MYRHLKQGTHNTALQLEDSLLGYCADMNFTQQPFCLPQAIAGLFKKVSPRDVETQTGVIYILCGDTAVAHDFKRTQHTP